jgi:hypothetical protein
MANGAWSSSSSTGGKPVGDEQFRSGRRDRFPTARIQIFCDVVSGVQVHDVFGDSGIPDANHIVTTVADKTVYVDVAC